MGVFCQALLTLMNPQLALTQLGSNSITVAPQSSNKAPRRSLACGRPIPYKITPRREGDIAQCWADPSLARELLAWNAKRGLEQMCADAWRWQQSCRNLSNIQSNQ